MSYLPLPIIICAWVLTISYATADAIRAFLSAHPVPAGKKYALIMDNAPWHKKTVRLVSDEALPEYADILESVVFIRLPPYSPDLNPIEQVWRITRRENTHNTFGVYGHRTLEELRTEIEKIKVPEFPHEE